MINFDALLEASKTTTIEDIQAHVESQNEGRRFNDDFWSPTTDKAGNALAEIRFLPTPPGEKSPFISYYEHFFKGPTGKVYAEKSLTTIGQKDPIGEANSKLWNSGFEADKEVARSRSRKQKFVANVLVIRDKNNPENDGKVKRWRYGKKVHEKILKAMSPEFDTDAKINAFDLLNTGANFRVVVKKVSGYPNYDDSHFGPQGALFGGDIAKMKSVFDGQEIKGLAELIAPDKFKTYAELLAKFKEVMGEADDEMDVTARAEQSTRAEPAPVQQRREEPARTAPAETAAPAVEEAAGDGDDLNFFRNLARGASQG